jgi:hypothetical protein
VQPLLRRFWTHPFPEVLKAMDQAVEAAEQSAAQAKPSEGLETVLRAAEAHQNAVVVLRFSAPGTAARRLPDNDLIRLAVADTAVAAAQAAAAAAKQDDNACAVAALVAYFAALDAVRRINVTGADGVLRYDLTYLQRAAEEGKWTDSTPVDPTSFALEKELRTYHRELPRLLADAEGKFAVIHGDEVSGTWETYEDALQAGYDRYQLTPFLVKKVSADALE